MRIPTKEGISGISTPVEIQTGQTQMVQNVFSAATDMYLKYKDEKDSSDLQDAQNKRIKDINDWKGENFKKEGEAAIGMTKSYLDKSKEIDGSLTQNLSPKAQKAYANWSLRSGEDDRLSVMFHEQKQDMAVKTSRFNNGLTLSEEMVRKDAKNWQGAANHLDDTLQNAKSSGLIKPEDFDTKKAEITNKFRNELGKSYYNEDKHEFIKKMNKNEFGFGEGEKGIWNEKYKDDLRADQREKKTMFAEEARLIMDQRKDFQAQAMDKGDTTHYFDSAKKLTEMGYSQWGRDLEKEGKLYNKTIKFNNEYKNAPLSEKLNAAKALTIGDQVQGSGLEFESRKTIQKEVMKQTQAFNKDPAQYVSKFAQGSTMEEIAGSRISLQRSQGIIPEKGFHILTEEEKTNYKQGFEVGDEKQKAELVTNLGKYGKHAPKVIHELGINKSLALASMFENPKDIELLVSGATSKPVNLNPDIKSSDYTADAQESKFFRMMGKVQSNFPTDSALGESLKDIQSTMVNISMKKQDTKAGPKFFDDNFHTEEDADKMIYFPKSHDADDVIKTLDAKKKQISDSISTSNGEFDTKAKWAVRDYTWVNSPSGFILADKKTGRVVPGSTVDYEEVKHGLATHKTRKDLISGE